MLKPPTRLSRDFFRQDGAPATNYPLILGNGGDRRAKESKPRVPRQETLGRKS